LVLDLSTTWEVRAHEKRKTFVHATTLEQRLADEAKRLRKRAKQLPYSKAREELLGKARQAELAAYQ
jgi:hypothetical protein